MILDLLSGVAASPPVFKLPVPTRIRTNNSQPTPQGGRRTHLATGTPPTIEGYLPTPDGELWGIPPI